jgi:hypothetical protein
MMGSRIGWLVITTISGEFLLSLHRSLLCPTVCLSVANVVSVRWGDLQHELG